MCVCMDVQKIILLGKLTLVWNFRIYDFVEFVLELRTNLSQDVKKLTTKIYLFVSDVAYSLYFGGSGSLLECASVVVESLTWEGGLSEK